MGSPIEILVVGKDGASQPLRLIEGQLKSLGSTAQAESPHVGGIFKTVAASAAGFLSANIIGGIGRQFADFARGAIQESRDAAHGLAQTEAVIKSTGGAAGVTAKQIVDLSGALSHTTLFTDDAIQAQQSLLLTFSQVQNKAGEGNDIFTQASKIGLDMAQALGTDAAGGAVALGKSLNDPISGISALSRVGVTFTDQQKAQIKSMAEHNNVIGAQKIILSELSKEFGGSAAAALKADGGFHLFNQRMADVKQTIGDALMPAMTTVMGFMAGPAMNAVEGLGTKIAGGLGTSLAWLASTALPAFSLGWQSLQAPLQSVVKFLSPIVAGFVSFESQISPLGAAIGALTSSWSDLVATWQDTHSIADLVDVFIGALEGFGPAGNTVSTFIAVARDFGTMVGGIGASLWNGDTAGAVAAFQTGIAGIGADISSLVANIGTWLSDVGTTIVTNVTTWGDAFGSWIGPRIPGMLDALGGLAAAIGGWIAEQPGVWGTQFLTWAQGFLDWVAPMIPPALAALDTLITSIGGWVVAQVPVLTSQLLAWGQGFVDWVAPMIPPALAALDSLIASIGGWVVTQVPVLAAQLQAWGQGFVSWIGPMLPPLMTALGGIASGVLGWIGQQAAPIVAQLQTWATSFISWIPGATATFLAQWPGMLNQFLGWIGSAAGPLLLKLGDWALQFTAWIIPMIPGFVVALGGIAVALVTFIAETAVVLLGKVQEWGHAFGSWISTTAIPALVAAWPGFLASLNGLLDQANSWMAAKAAEIGHAIISGIMSGLDSAAGALFGKLNSLASSALAAMKSGLGIHSPSTVFRDQVGVPIVQGMQLGILNTMPQLLATMRGSTDSLIQEIVGFLDQDGTGALTKAGADAINALARGMQDLAPALPQLAAGYGGIAAAAQQAAAATVRATDDILSHIKMMGDPSSGGLLSFLNGVGGLGGTADYAKQAGSNAGMTFGDGWKSGIEQIAPITQTTLQQLQDVVLVPWQDNTRTFFSGAGFGFIGAASEGINSAGNGLATSAGNVGGAAGAAIVGALRGNLGGVTGFVSDVNAALAKIVRDITITVTTVYKDGGNHTGGLHLPHFATGVQNFAGGLAVVGDVLGGSGEIVELPRGSNVYTNNESRGMMGRGERVVESHTHKYYQLTIHTTAQIENVEQDFRLMEVMAGR